MPRLLPTLLVVALMGGTAAAFAVSERLKLQRSPIAATRITKIFSPICDCGQRRAEISFRLRKSDHLRLRIIDSDGDAVRTLVDGRRFGRGFHHFTWNGRGDAGALVREGRYRPKVELEEAGRTIVLPNSIRVDRTRPQLSRISVRPRVLSPDGDSRGDRVVVGYRASERAHVLLLVNGERRVRSRSQRPAWHVEWYGKLNARSLPPGSYRLAVVAEDLAGNLSVSVPAGTVRIRYVELGIRTLRARPNERLAIPVSTDARRVDWTLRRGSSLVARASSARVVRLRAPRRPGRYVLVVAAAGHTARALVLVRKGR